MPNDFQFSKFAGRILGASLLGSVLLHLLILFFANRLSEFTPANLDRAPSLEISLVNPKLLETIDTLQETAKEKPKDAQFAAPRDLTAQEEMSPEFSETNVAAPSEPQVQQLEQPKKIKSFSLSEDEMIALNDPLLRQAAPTRQERFSPGFIERLKKGEQLKVNALGLDYGQYLVRMKERLVQRWNPRRTIAPAMYEYQEVVVTVAVVLNDKGELMDIRVVSGSLFPRYDQEAVNAFRESAPFPNPPDSLIQDDGRVYLPWAFHLSFRGWGSTVN